MAIKTRADAELSSAKAAKLAEEQSAARHRAAQAAAEKQLREEAEKIKEETEEANEDLAKAKAKEMKIVQAKTREASNLRKKMDSLESKSHNQAAEFMNEK